MLFPHKSLILYELVLFHSKEFLRLWSIIFVVFSPLWKMLETFRRRLWRIAIKRNSCLIQEQIKVLLIKVDSDENGLNQINFFILVFFWRRLFWQRNSFFLKHLQLNLFCLHLVYLLYAYIFVLWLPLKFILVTSIAIIL